MKARVGGINITADNCFTNRFNRVDFCVNKPFVGSVKRKLKLAEYLVWILIEPFHSKQFLNGDDDVQLFGCAAN